MSIRGKNILVVDDEAQILNFLIRMLASKGFRVTGASSAEEALDRYSGSFDLVVPDLTLSGKSGLWLLSQIRQKSSTVKFILMSGTADVRSLQGLEKQKLTQFIRKPFKIEEMLEKMNA